MPTVKRCHFLKLRRKHYNQLFQTTFVHQQLRECWILLNSDNSMFDFAGRKWPKKPVRSHSTVKPQSRILSILFPIVVWVFSNNTLVRYDFLNRVVGYNNKIFAACRTCPSQQQIWVDKVQEWFGATQIRLKRVWILYLGHSIQFHSAS